MSILNGPYRRRWSVLVSSGALAFLAAAYRPAAPESQFETPSMLKASEILSPDLLKGQHHEVEEEVANDGYWNTYRIRSEFGDFAAHGYLMLRVRLHEIEAIAKLKEVNEAAVVAGAAVDSVGDVAKSVATAASRPDDTVVGIGGGVKRLFGRVGGGAKGIGGGDEEEAKTTPGHETEEESSPGEKVAGGTASVGKHMLGVSEAERRWAKKLKVDPYTTNELLRKEIARVAGYEAAGRVASDVLVPMPRALTMTASVSDLVWEQSPDDLRALNEKRLEEMEVEEAASRSFRENEHYTLSYQTVLVGFLHELTHVPGRADFVERAAHADSEEQALFYVECAGLLTAFNDQVAKVQELIPDAIAAIVEGQRLVHLIPVDYLFWTEELSGYVEQATRRARERSPQHPPELWLTGKTSQRAGKELRSRGWLLHEGKLSIDLELR